MINGAQVPYCAPRTPTKRMQASSPDERSDIQDHSNTAPRYLSLINYHSWSMGIAEGSPTLRILTSRSTKRRLSIFVRHEPRFWLFFETRMTTTR